MSTITALLAASRTIEWSTRAAATVHAVVRHLAARLRGAAQPRAAAHEASDLRALAGHIARRDPSMAADLLAAADRHEAAAVH